jgi:hypothetical protein
MLRNAHKKIRNGLPARAGELAKVLSGLRGRARFVSYRPASPPQNGMQHATAARPPPGSAEYFGSRWRQIIGDQEGGDATMATYRLADILKSISDLSDDEIERMNESEAWQWIRANASAGERGDEAPGDCEHR